MAKTLYVAPFFLLIGVFAWKDLDAWKTFALESLLIQDDKMEDIKSKKGLKDSEVDEHLSDPDLDET